MAENQQLRDRQQQLWQELEPLAEQRRDMARRQERLRWQRHRALIRIRTTQASALGRQIAELQQSQAQLRERYQRALQELWQIEQQLRSS